MPRYHDDDSSESQPLLDSEESEIEDEPSVRHSTQWELSLIHI